MSSESFGSRYGRKIRERVKSITAKYKWRKQECPFCGKIRVKRDSKGIFHCDHCKKIFAGGAYEKTTLSKRILGKIFDREGKVVASKVPVDLTAEIEEIEKENIEAEEAEKAK